MKNENLIGVVLALSLLILCSSLLIGVINLGTQIAAFWVLLTFQILLVIIGVVVTVLIISYLIGQSYKMIMSKIDEVRLEHKEALLEIKKRTASFITTTVLIADAVLIITDKSFDGDPLPTVIISLFLLIFFWIANELMITENKWKRIFGVSIWVFSILLLPTLVILFNIEDLDSLYSSIYGLSLSNKLLISFTFIGFVVIPFGVQRIIK